MAGKKSQKPIKAFLEHQGRALEESGKAVASLLPKGFRDHAGNALKEGKAGWGALFDGVIDTVQGGLGKLRSQPEPAEDEKVKVEVE